MKERYHSLQILRALAAWMVVYHHYMQSFYNFNHASTLGYLFSTYGNFGVDIFFVLSGFVMYLSAQSPNVDGRQFFINRIFRVVPAYWFYTLLLVVFIPLFPLELAYTDYSAKSLVASLLFIPHENPSGLGTFPLLTVGWSLNFEMMFYLILSLSLLCCKKYALALCAFIVLVSPLVWPESYPFGPVLSSFSLYEFFAGLAVAYIVYHPLFKYVLKYRLAFALLSLVVALACFPLFDTLKPLKVVAASGIVFSAILVNCYINQHNKVINFFIKLGDYSYPTYLAHVLVLAVILHLFGNTFSFSEEILVLVFLTTVLYFLSKISYQLIEQNNMLNTLKKNVCSTLKTKNKIIINKMDLK